MDQDGDLHTPDGLIVPESALVWAFARSGGAGGQHVNKTSSKVTLTIAVETVLGPTAAIERLRSSLPSEVRTTSQTSRSQWRNRQLCLQQISEILDAAAKPPATKRKKSKPTRGSIERRLASKRRDSEKKESRRVNDW